MVVRVPGYLLLEGGAEFGGKMAEPDRRAIELAGGNNARICIIPTAAAPDHNHQRAGNNGARWFRKLGATNVDVLPLIDAASAGDPGIVAQIEQSTLIYMLGGFTGYLGQTLKASRSFQAMLKAYDAGAVIAGSSAGAMVMCQYFFDPAIGQVVEGLNLLPNTCVLPHHNTFGKRWSTRLTSLFPGVVLVGIDEQTGMIDDGSAGSERKADWHVYGKGEITLYQHGQVTIHKAGERFHNNFMA
jgi:cyanophycinase